MSQKRGFTLVEVLIVMLIMAILAGALLLNQFGSEASAQAAAILNDLRLMKSGAHLFLVENPDFSGASATNYAAGLGKYMDHGRIINNPVRYAFYVVGGTQWVGVRVDGVGTGNRLNAILAQKAQNSAIMPLYGSDDIETSPSGSNPPVYNKSHVAVWTPAR